MVAGSIPPSATCFLEPVMQKLLSPPAGDRELLDMKITVKSIFDPNETELDTQSTTLGALLNELSNNQGVATVQFYDSQLGEIHSDCEVLVNGQALTDGLNTKLNDGDRVEIYIIMRSGG